LANSLSSQQFEWTQPIGGQKIVWRPLKVGDHIDLDTNYASSSMAALKPYATLAVRIISVDGIEKAKLPGGDLVNVREWDEHDFIAFKDEIETRELARSVALAPQRPGGVVTSLEQAVNKAQLAATELAQSLNIVLQKAKEAEQKLGPLK
jgi:hypothetical protein